MSPIYAGEDEEVQVPPAPSPDTPPKGRKQRSDAGKPRGTRGPRSGRIGKQITELVTAASAFVGMRDPFDGVILETGAPKLGETWGPVIERNPRAREFFKRLEAGGVYGGAILATLSVALPIVVHHLTDPDLKQKLWPFAMYVMPKGAAERLHAMQRQGTAAQDPTANGSQATPVA